MSDAADPMEQMLAEWQIRDVIGRYARGVDRQDGDIIGSCFYPGALTHYGDFDGSIETFVPWVLAYVENYRATMHFMGTTVIDWPERGREEAVAETYAAVWHEVAAGTPGRSWVGGIRYIDRFERRPAPGTRAASWRIAERTVVGDWLRIDPSENHRRFAEVMLTGQPGGDDPVYAILARLAPQ
ncbi:MAG: nuclear transport factor 2 family protein [Hyphomicrobiales bacterium]|nr:MAG: nuclear transport factor 2 family protein [Hyphomicrobiales bacterium]